MPLKNNNMPPFSNFTVKAQEAVRKAHELTIERGQNQVDVMHLLAALVLQDESVVISVLEKLEVDINFLSDTIFENMSEMEHSSVATPSYQVYITRSLVARWKFRTKYLNFSRMIMFPPSIYFWLFWIFRQKPKTFLLALE